MDNLYSSKKNNIEEFLNNKNYEFIEHNIIEPFYLDVDKIYNLACPASPDFYQKDPIYTMKTSIFGALNVLENAIKTNAVVLQASTSEIYGSPTLHPQTENYWGNVNPVGFRSCYSEGKRAAETIFYDYLRNYDLDIKIARIFNSYGPKMREDDGRAIPNFIVNALKNNKIEIFGNGNHTRSFCYISDLVDALIKMMNSDLSGPINLGKPEEITIQKLAKKIVSLGDSKSKIIYKKSRCNDPKHRKPDISLAKNKLNWDPKHNLLDGLIKTIDYFKKVLK